MRSFGVVFAASAALAGMVGSASAADKIKVGFFSTLEGPYTALGEDGHAGFRSRSDATSQQGGGQGASKSSEASSDASPNSATACGQEAWSSRTRSRS